MARYSSTASLRPRVRPGVRHAGQSATHSSAGADVDAPVLTPAEALWVMVGMAALTLAVWAV